MSIICWWKGCKPKEDDGYTPPEYLQCKRCGCGVEYSDLVGDTREARFNDWCNYWLFRKWFPKKCSSCGHRYKCDESVDHIPF